MLVGEDRAANPAQVATQNTVSHDELYGNHAGKSRESLREQVGLLLWGLQGSLSERQCGMGWSLFEVLLVQYLAGRESAQ